MLLLCLLWEILLLSVAEYPNNHLYSTQKLLRLKDSVIHFIVKTFNPLMCYKFTNFFPFIRLSSDSRNCLLRQSTRRQLSLLQNLRRAFCALLIPLPSSRYLKVVLTCSFLWFMLCNCIVLKLSLISFWS